MKISNNRLRLKTRIKKTGMPTRGKTTYRQKTTWPTTSGARQKTTWPTPSVRTLTCHPPLARTARILFFLALRSVPSSALSGIVADVVSTTAALSTAATITMIASKKSAPGLDAPRTAVTAKMSLKTAPGTWAPTLTRPTTTTPGTTKTWKYSGTGINLQSASV